MVGEEMFRIGRSLAGPTVDPLVRTPRCPEPRCAARDEGDASSQVPSVDDEQLDDQDKKYFIIIA